jgi:hypothetical protein
MRSMELRALCEHEQLVRAIAEGRGDDADELARHHGVIDFELITTAMRRAGCSPTDDVGSPSASRSTAARGIPSRHHANVDLDEI